MIRTPQFVLAAAITAALSASACQPAHNERAADTDKGAPTPAVSEQEKPGSANPSDLSAVQAEIRIDDVTLGYAVAADDTIPAEQKGDDFARETVYVSMKVEDTPAGSVVKAAWFAPGDLRVHEDTKTVSSGQQHLSFKADTKDWALGDYRVEVWLGDEKVATEHFNIVASRESQV